jgi:hypothetical protein
VLPTSRMWSFPAREAVHPVLLVDIRLWRWQTRALLWRRALMPLLMEEGN